MPAANKKYATGCTAPSRQSRNHAIRRKAPDRNPPGRKAASARSGHAPTPAADRHDPAPPTDGRIVHLPHVQAGGAAIDAKHAAADPACAPHSPSAGTPASRRAAQVAECFGITAEQRRAILPHLTLPIGPGRVIAFVGPSGSGKTTALNALADQFPQACALDRIRFPEGRALIDAIAPDAPLADALELLSRSALGEARLWLQRFETLSAGERFRAKLARAWGLTSPGGMLLIDEFGSGLHARAARAIAYHVRRLASRRGLCVAVATCREDVLTDLQPDTLVRLNADAAADVRHRRVRNCPLDLWRRMRISHGVRRDYDNFAAMHYRSTEELGFVDRIFLLHDRAQYSPVGIAVYCHPPAELALRNQATEGRYKRNLRRLNAEVRILRRLVLHPDLRGCGVAHRFVRRTLRLLDMRYVECLAAMGAVNPVFEKAGMTRVGRCLLPRAQQRIIDELAALDVDVFAGDFETQVCTRPAVRECVARLVQNWYRATTGNGYARPARQSPALLARLCRGLVGARPVYYLWENQNWDRDQQEAEQLRRNRVIIAQNEQADQAAGAPD